jgi:hypothetical protein
MRETDAELRGREAIKAASVMVARKRLLIRAAARQNRRVNVLRRLVLAFPKAILVWIVLFYGFGLMLRRELGHWPQAFQDNVPEGGMLIVDGVLGIGMVALFYLFFPWVLGAIACVARSDAGSRRNLLVWTGLATVVAIAVYNMDPNGLVEWYLD